MEFLGLSVDIKNIPPLDPGFIPLHRFNKAFLAGARKPVSLAFERTHGELSAYHTFIYGTPEMHAADCYYMDRLVKFLLWMKGGFRIYVSGDSGIYQYLKACYAPGGQRDFDQDFMAGVYEHPFEVVETETIPGECSNPRRIGGNFNGCRIGFDAGGSDRKVSAVVNGATVFSEEVVWFPKDNADPNYHYDGIVSALKSAAAHMPRVDAVGISSAGVYIDNRTMVASLFRKVPRERFDAEVKNIFIRAVADTFGDIPCSVINDGDVSALAGAVSLGENDVLGMAMGTSEATGFVDASGCITGWLNELAFAPVDAAPGAETDVWSRDFGVGAGYFSQDAVIRLAPAAGIHLEQTLSPAEKLKAVQALMEQDDPRAAAIYRTMGVYLAHTLVLYYDFYHFRHVLLLGRVMSGKGGDLLLETCKAVLTDEYPDVAAAVHPTLPDENFRRVGQSAIAASLPEIL